MSQKTFHIPNISCGHCVNAIKNELSEMNGVRVVDGSPETRQIEVQWDEPATEDQIRQTLRGINYPAE
jgi:copper chaperone CopZ